MSLQGAIADSDELKSRSMGNSGLLTVFRFDHSGSLKDRLLTALIVLAVAVGLTFVSLYLPYGRLVGVAFASAVGILSAFEVARLFSRDDRTLAYRPIWGTLHFMLLALPNLAATVSSIGGVIEGVIDWKAVVVATGISAAGLLLLNVIAGRNSLEDGAKHAQSFAPAALIVGICAPNLIIITTLPNGIHLLWWLVGVVALNDAGAYFAGRLVGKHKLAPALSPNKTVEGSLAGLLVGGVAGVTLGQTILGGVFDAMTLVVVSSLVVVSAQCGDLAKSYLKRLRGVKDTGAFFPGHGGILDRFDGMIGGAPIVVTALALLGLL